MTEKQIKEEIISIVDSNYMKDFLLEKQNEIKIFEYVEIIATAPISLEKKVDLLTDLLDVSMNEEDYKYTNESLQMVKTAINHLYNVDRTKNLLLLTCIDIESGEHSLLEATPVLSYKGALQYIEENYNYINDDEKDSILEDRECDFYFRLEMYGIQDDETLSQQYCYILSPSGEVQYFRNDFDKRKHTSDIGKPKPTLFYMHSMNSEFAMTPYKNGDILYVDCRPYNLPSYCLIYYINQSTPRDCCALRCFYPAYDGIIGEGAFKHGHFSTMVSDYYTDCYVSPLFRAELYNGELPETCSFMKILSPILKKYPELGADIDSLMLEYGEDFSIPLGAEYKSVHGITEDNWLKIFIYCQEYEKSHEPKDM